MKGRIVIMIYTSHFNNINKLPKDSYLISLSPIPPISVDADLSLVTPSYILLMCYKEYKVSNEEFEKLYKYHLEQDFGDIIKNKIRDALIEISKEHGDVFILNYDNSEDLLCRRIFTDWLDCGIKEYDTGKGCELNEVY